MASALMVVDGSAHKVVESFGRTSGESVEGAFFNVAFFVAVDVGFGPLIWLLVFPAGGFVVLDTVVGALFVGGDVDFLFAFGDVVFLFAFGDVEVLFPFGEVDVFFALLVSFLSKSLSCLGV